MFFLNIASNYAAIRFYNNTWSDWSDFALDIPTFYKNYADLSSLASALGGIMKPLTYGSSNVTAEQVNSTNLRGVFAITNQSTLPVSYGCLASFICDGSGWLWGIQLLAGAGTLYYRYGQGAPASFAWVDWKQIQLIQ